MLDFLYAAGLAAWCVVIIVCNLAGDTPAEHVARRAAAGMTPREDGGL